MEYLLTPMGFSILTFMVGILYGAIAMASYHNKCSWKWWIMGFMALGGPKYVHSLMLP